MPLIPINVVGPDTTYEELREEFAKLQKNLDYLLNGKMDSLNVSELNADVLEAGSITTDKIQAGAITTDLIANDAIISQLIASGAVTQDEIADAAVVASKIAAGAVIAGKIAAGAVTADKISVSQLSAIAANMGTLTSGQIFGAFIATGQTFPVIQFNSAGQLLQAYKDASHYISIDPNFTGNPSLQFYDGNTATMNMNPANPGNFVINSVGKLTLTSSVSDVDIRPSNNFSINGAPGYTGSFVAGTKTVIVTKGIITSVV